MAILRERAAREKAVIAKLAAEKAAAKKKKAKAAARARRRAAGPTRRSRRQHCGRVGDSSDWGVVEAKMLLRCGYKLHKCDR
jgi:hypothetical protein